MSIRSLNTANEALEPTKRRPEAAPRSNSRLRRGWLLSAARFIAGRRGAAVVEFAFVSPVLLLALFGILEFSYLLWKRHSLEFAVEESGRMILTQQSITDAAIIADVKSRIYSIASSNVTATVQRETIGVTSFVTIDVSYTYPMLFAGFLGLDPIPLATKTRVPLRQND